MFRSLPLRIAALRTSTLICTWLGLWARNALHKGNAVYTDPNESEVSKLRYLCLRGHR